jgi:hypothetical protein
MQSMRICKYYTVTHGGETAIDGVRAATGAADADLNTHAGDDGGGMMMAMAMMAVELMLVMLA